MGAALTQRELAQATGLTLRRIQQINEALPDGEKLFVQRADGGYELGAFVQRWVKYNTDRQEHRSASLEAMKTIHEQVKTQKTELEVQRMSGALLDAEAVRILWGNVIVAARNNLLGLPGRVAPVIAGLKSAELIAGELDHEIRAALTALADMPGTGDPAIDYAGEGEEDGEAEEDGAGPDD